MKKWFSVPRREDKEEEDSMCQFVVLGIFELYAEKGSKLSVSYTVNFCTLKFPPLTISFSTVDKGRNLSEPFKWSQVQETLVQIQEG